MQLFLRNIWLFFIPILFILALIMVMETLLPPAFFTFRPWEGARFNFDIYSNTPFYPNLQFKMKSVGDLCHHTQYAIENIEAWKTDKLGFRNDTFIDKPDVVIIGDSFIAGSGLTQKDIFSNKLTTESKGKLKVYNMAPSSLLQFARYLNAGVIKKPKLVIFSAVERYTPLPFDCGEPNYNDRIFVKITQKGNLNMYLDKACRFNSIQWLDARMHGSKGKGFRAIDNSNMYFYQGQQQHKNKNDFRIAAQNIISYKNFCDSQGIEFLFVPMPDKESVYYKLVPFSKQCDYLLQLDSLLNQEKVATINTLKIYNDFIKTHDTFLYKLDDTHWNPVAVSLVSKEVYNFISSRRLDN